VLHPENSFGIKAGGGIDYFLTENLALNTEVGWKFNRGTLRIGATDSRGQGWTGNNHFNADTVSVVFGVRYYLPKG
jgi:opacity protein-like surface antigen